MINLPASLQQTAVVVPTLVVAVANQVVAVATLVVAVANRAVVVVPHLCSTKKRPTND